jgi:hypothetical protein
MSPMNLDPLQSRSHASWIHIFMMDCVGERLK